MICSKLDALKNYLESQDKELVVRTQYFSIKKPVDQAAVKSEESSSTGSNSDLVELGKDAKIEQQSKLVDQLE